MHATAFFFGDRDCVLRRPQTPKEKHMKIYVASSWRNERQPEVVRCLRQRGHEVYDFRHPTPGDFGFRWSEIDLEVWPESGGGRVSGYTRGQQV